MLELELARLDLRVVEDVVDHVSSASPLERTTSANSRCSPRQLGVEQEIGHADHGVHRRADLVAHRGEEVALRLRRGFRFLARALKLGDVVIDPKEADLEPFHGERDEHELDVDHCPVLPHALCDPVRAAAAIASAVISRPSSRSAVAEDELVDCRPIASSAEYPKSSAAAGFHRSRARRRP